MHLTDYGDMYYQRIQTPMPVKRHISGCMAIREVFIITGRKQYVATRFHRKYMYRYMHSHCTNAAYTRLKNVDKVTNFAKRNQVNKCKESLIQNVK